MDALSVARLCQAAYTAAPDISRGDVVRAIVRDLPGGGAVIAFQGTANGPQALADLDMGPMIVPGVGGVHAGFWLAAQAVAEQVAAVAARGPLVLTGHSLGGALAVASAALLHLVGRTPGALITFGAPKVGIGQGLGAMLTAWQPAQCRHAADPVPDLPIRIPGLMDWRHLSPLLTQLGPPGGMPRVSDHAIAAYVAALSTAAR